MTLLFETFGDIALYGSSDHSRPFSPCLYFNVASLLMSPLSRWEWTDGRKRLSIPLTSANVKADVLFILFRSLTNRFYS